MSKVKLSEKYVDLLNKALETSLKEEIVVSTIQKDWVNEFFPLNELTFFEITSAMLNGYEKHNPEQEAKEHFENEFNYFNLTSTEMYRMGMADFANAHGIHYYWLNPKEQPYPWTRKENRNATGKTNSNTNTF